MLLIPSSRQSMLQLALMLDRLAALLSCRRLEPREKFVGEFSPNFLPDLWWPQLMARRLWHASTWSVQNASSQKCQLAGVDSECISPQTRKSRRRAEKECSKPSPAVIYEWRQKFSTPTTSKIHKFLFRFLSLRMFAFAEAWRMFHVLRGFSVNFSSDNFKWSGRVMKY